MSIERGLTLRSATGLGEGAPRAAVDPAAPPGRAASHPGVEELLLQADVNQQNLEDTVIVLRTPEGRFLVAADDLDRWRIRHPHVPPFQYDGKAYYPLSALPGATYRLDESKQTLAITVAANTFGETAETLEVSGKYQAPVVPKPGGFLNYSLSADSGDAGSSKAGTFEAGIFSRRGVLTSGVLAPDLMRESTWVRLDTTYEIDDPSQRRSLRLGDAVSQGGSWGRPVRFGGVQLGTNFATQPGFIRYPVLAASGQATLPSTVDVFVNNALVTRQSVPPGPFSVRNIPTVTGSGDIRLVVRDLLGREQVVTLPFYGSTALLKEGLTDYSYEIGALRDNFGVDSNDYGSSLASATYRRGITNSLTGELHAEYSANVKAAGASANYLFHRLGVFSGTLALSDSAAGSGGLFGLGLERSTSRLSFGLNAQFLSGGFRQVGMAPGELPRRHQATANVGYQLGNLGSLSLTYVAQAFRDQPDVKVSTFGYSVPLGRLAYLSVNAVRTFGSDRSTSLFTTLTVPLGTTTSASLSTERTHAQDGSLRNSMVAQIQRSPPLGEGYGYRLQARDSDLLGSYTLQTAVGAYSVEAASAAGRGTATRLSASGGIGLVGGHPFLSRTITDSIAVVRVADYPNVRVLKDNQVVGRTDKDGYIVLPTLRPYEKNPIGIDPGDLPFDAKIGTLKLDAVPYYRSGVLVDFPVQRIRAGTFRVVLEDGRDMPSGALAQVEGKAPEFPIALRGEAYVEGLEMKNTIRVTWKGASCSFAVPYPKTTDPLPDLGTYVCKGVKP